jgi:hypothetical protein
MESIHTLGDSYDLLIFDESESNLAQLNSKETIVDFAITTNKLEKLMRDARQTIWSDAFVLDRSLVACARLRPNTKKLYIQNTHQPYNRQAYRVSRNAPDFCKFVKMFQSENPGKRIVIATGSRDNSDNIYNELKDVCKVLKINSYTSDSLTRSLSDVNAVWSQFDVVVYTTSITVGISYDDKKSPFDYLFLHFSCCSSTVRDLFQSSLRARTITTNTMYYGHYSHYNGDECWGEFDRDRLRDIVKKRNKNKEVTLKPWLLDLWAFTHQERNTNAFLHESVINEYLRMCGYTGHDLKPTKKEEKALKECDIEEYYDDNEYQTIKELTKSEFEDVDILVKKGLAEKIHKQQRKKFEFDNYILINKNDTGLSDRERMFQSFVRESSKIKETKENVIIEQKFSVDGELYVTPSVYVNNLKEKVARISTLTKILGVEFSYDTATITHDKIENTCEYIKIHINELKTEWSLDLRCHNKKTGKKEEKTGKKEEKTGKKEELGVLNQIFGKWGFQKIYRGEQKRKTCKKTGKRVDVSEYILRAADKYEDFDEYCLNKKVHKYKLIEYDF